ncbi:DUF664 domain-containing protein, partial [Actinophytocola sp.]|uniref:mycothiol transferase n=1 Tax=Actinophytocola sp. TaxID=1872138 RepID=UPI00389A02E6
MSTGIAADLHRYLQESRDSLLRSLTGLSEYDVRRPMTPTATNLLGVVKHLVGVEFGYLGDSVGRPAPVTLPWNEDGSVWESGDMWAKADETREYIVGLYQRAWQHSDESIEELPLDAPASVSWWPEERRGTTFGSLLVRVLQDTALLDGLAVVVGEMMDGGGGRDRDDVGDERWWGEY